MDFVKKVENGQKTHFTINNGLSRLDLWQSNFFQNF